MTNIFAIHDWSPEWGGKVRDAGRTGWCVTTHALGTNPVDYSGYNFQPLLEYGIHPVARLNNGYGKGVGCIPTPNLYNAFAQRCANFVTNSPGIEYIVIGNEIALEWEWPTDQPITLATYIDCYTRCYEAIRGVNSNVKIAPQAPGPWTINTPDAPDWIAQLSQMLSRIATRVDWIALHAYTRGYDLASFSSGARMDAPWQTHFSGWETILEYMTAIPPLYRLLPVIITESNGNDSWPDQNTGWVQKMYSLINDWNHGVGHQQILAAALFRWQPEDLRWDISRHPGSVADFVEALKHDYQPFRESTVTGETLYVTATAGLNLRMAPVNGNVLAVMPYASTFMVITRSGDGWAQGRYAGLVGWSSEEWLATTPAPELFCPVVAGTPITQRFGEHPEIYSRIPGYNPPLQGHNGLDYGVVVGSLIMAADDGVVSDMRHDTTGFGQMIRVRHGWGDTLYAHLSEMLVQNGQSVFRAQTIARSGSTGMSTGPHLHFGVRLNGFDKGDGWGGYSDPELFLVGAG